MEAKVKPFEVEEWMDTHETTAKYNIAESCAASISINDLQTLSKDGNVQLWDPFTKLTYGSIRGSPELRSNIARLYSGAAASSPLSEENILVTPGAIAANLIVFYALIRSGDHVICHYPTYQQLYDVPASLGAEVSLWKAKEDKEWQLDIEELKELIRPNTRMIIINTPQNPTGAIIPHATLSALIDIASSHQPPIIILSDEVYRPMFHTVAPTSPLFPPSVISLSYPHAVAIGSLSKAYALAGLRVGWIASRDSSIVEACAKARQYISISVSQLNDRVASVALGQDCVDSLLARNLDIARTNVQILEKWIDQHAWATKWAKPVAGTTAFVKFERDGVAVDDEGLCERLSKEMGLLLVPGSRCFGGGKDFKGYVRVGFCCETKVLEEGLEVLGKWMRENYEQVPMAL